MLALVEQLDAMDESMWGLLQRNLTGITEAEADWRPHPAANPVRWMVGHLAWFEEWAHDALLRNGRYLADRDPTAYLDGPSPSWSRDFRRHGRAIGNASPSSMNRRSSDR